MVRLLPILVMIAAAAACSSQAAESSAPPAATTPSPVALSPTPPAAIPSPTPTPRPAATPTALPANVAVVFKGLRAAVYPTHLHSRCDGSQQFHILVLPNVVVGAAGTGVIAVPRGYFGRGLCVIVYGSPALTTVVATRRL